MKVISYPINSHEILRNKRSIKRALSARSGTTHKKIAILGGSTTAEIRDTLELFLLDRGIKASFYESAYNKYYEESVYPTEALIAFKPDLVVIHTTNVNLTRYPAEGDVGMETLIEQELQKYLGIWEALNEKFNCPIIQNNFDPPRLRPLGNLEAYHNQGTNLFINRLNLAFAEAALKRDYLYLHDIQWLAAKVGLDIWHDPTLWYAYKYAISYPAIPIYANSLASIIGAIYGVSRKCLVLDLDNTLWGGIVGDEGAAALQIGNETAEGEAYRDLQAYTLELKKRGVILAVASKNNPEAATEGLNHPENILKPQDFSVVKAGWNPKNESLRQIAEELNIGIDALVFIDDNPAERDLVRSHEPMVTVPEIGSDVVNFCRILDETGVFEPASISREDLARSQMYAENSQRIELAKSHASYDDFLKSLQMRGHIRAFGEAYLDRIAQLINKTNQFNLTTRRYTLAQVESMARSPGWITLQGRLIDRFGDNGIVSIIAGEVMEDRLRIDLWLMSCRVLKRGMELAMIEALIRGTLGRGIRSIVGEYFPTAKNDMVKDLYPSLGFQALETRDDGASTWILSAENCQLPHHHIELLDDY